MNITKNLRNLSLVALAVLGMQATSSQADFEMQGPPHKPYVSAHPSPQGLPFKQQLGDFDLRMDKQLQDILQGMEKGHIIQREAIALLREHLEINALERSYMRDGRLGPFELSDLQRRLDQAEKNIKKLSKNKERTGSKGPVVWSVR